MPTLTPLSESSKTVTALAEAVGKEGLTIPFIPSNGTSAVPSNFVSPILTPLTEV